MSAKKKLTQKEAQGLFEDANKTLEYIAGIKWNKGFVCRKCGYDNYCEGKTPHSRRCTRCKTEESAAAHTIFHNVKFPINKAFYIAYNVCVLQNDISTYCLADELGLNQMTCWKFRKRILDCMENQSTEEKKNIKGILMKE